MRWLPGASLAVAATLGAVASGCGGGDKPAATTTTATSLEETTTTLAATTTSTTIDPALRELLLVAADLPEGFEEQAAGGTRTALFTTCDSSTAPAVRAVYDAPTVDGSTFQRGANGAVKVASSVISAQPGEAEPGLNELLDPKVKECLEADLRSLVEKDQPTGATVTLKLSATKATISGADQTVLLSSTATVKADTTTSTARLDFVFLRKADTILVVTYGGPTNLTSVAERQKIVAAAARKLAGGDAAATSTTGGGSTTSTRRTSTTRRATTTTRRSASTTATTGATTSSTKAATTTTM